MKEHAESILSAIQNQDRRYKTIIRRSQSSHYDFINLISFRTAASRVPMLQMVWSG